MRQKKGINPCSSGGRLGLIVLGIMDRITSLSKYEDESSLCGRVFLAHLSATYAHREHMNKCVDFQNISLYASTLKVH